MLKGLKVWSPMIFSNGRYTQFVTNQLINQLTCQLFRAAKVH